MPADTFALRLKAVRLHAGDITIVQAAERTGITNQSWSNWEKGGKPRDLVDAVELISREFGIDRDWLLFGGPLARQEPTRHRGARRMTSTGRAAQHMTTEVTDVTCQYDGQPSILRRRPFDSRPAGHPNGVRRPARLTPPIAA